MNGADVSPADLAVLLPDTDAMPRPGDVLADRYLVEGILGCGGYTVLFAAIDLLAAGDARSVALKMLRPAARFLPAAADALSREHRVLSALSHPCLRRSLAIEEEGERRFLVLERVEAAPLDEIPPVADALRGPIGDICETVAYLHERDWLHLDLKPANFLLRRGRPMLIDFGCARHRLDPAGSPASLTPCWASPDLLSGAEPCPADDVFALGCLLYWLWTRRHPFDRLSSCEARRLYRQADCRDLPKMWREPVAFALSFDAGNRPTAGALLDVARRHHGRKKPAAGWLASRCDALAGRLSRLFAHSRGWAGGGAGDGAS